MTAAGDFGTEEGEIQEAIPLPRSRQESRIDRIERNRFPRSDDYEQSNGRRSRSPRGFKRSGDDRDNHRDDHKYRGSQEYPGRENQRYGYDKNRYSSRQPYQDLDRPDSRGRHSNSNERSSNRFGNGGSSNSRQHGYRYDDRRHRGYDRDMYSDEYSAKRSRYRSRSPRGRDHREQGPQVSFAIRNDPNLNQNGQVKGPEKATSFYQASQSNEKSGETDVDPDFDWDPAQERDKEADEKAEIERRRRAREAVLKRAVGTIGDQTSQGKEPTSSTAESTQANTPTPVKMDLDTPVSGESDNVSPVFSPTTVGFDEKTLGKSKVNADVEAGPSAADYDPLADMREDERRNEMRHSHVGLHGEARELTAGLHKAPANTDDDDEFDMFDDDLDEQKLEAAASKLNEAAQAQKAHEPIGAGIDGDDAEGYFKIRPGEILGGRYRIISELGSGMFSGVARAEDIQNGNKAVAVKIIRNNAALRRAALTEIAILQKLNSNDPKNKQHIVRFLSSFDYRGHLCMVFESLDLNLREVLKRYGKDTGINLRAIRNYAFQMFIALAYMRKHDIIHADLKPDNILVDESRATLKVCDLGTAIDRSDAATAANEVTPYLVSRFYRAPEVIMGAPYDSQIDMWSIGCTLYELYTDHILFDGSSNNQMLKKMQEVKGKINLRLQRRGELSHNHFDNEGNFISQELDRNTGKLNIRVIAAFQQTNKLREGIVAASKGVPEDQNTDLRHFIDLVDRCLYLHPDKRLTPELALKHDFFLSMKRDN